MFNVCEKGKLYIVHTVYGVMNSLAGSPMFLIYEETREDFVWRYASQFVPEKEAQWYARRKGEEARNK
jgi:hypothetical protein